MAIERFGKETPYFFMSSMFPVPGGIEVPAGLVVPEAMVVPTSENIYQAYKFELEEARRQVLEAENGYRAKKVADSLTSVGLVVRQDWPEIKIPLMEDAVARKFKAGSKLAQLILQTGDEELIQGNTHGDTFWGVSPPGSGNGLNWLGRILMARRSVLRKMLASSK